MKNKQPIEPVRATRGGDGKAVVPKVVQVNTAMSLIVNVGDSSGNYETLQYDINPGQHPPPLPVVGELVDWLLPSGNRVRTQVSGRYWDSSFGSGLLKTTVRLWVTKVP